MYSKVEESFEGESVLPKNTTHSFIQGLNSDVSILSPAHIMLDHYKKKKKIYACLENPTPSPHNFSGSPSLRPARPGIYFLFIVISLFFPSAKCLSSLSSLPASSLSSEYGPLLNCLCSWDRTTDVLELINDLIASRMTGQRKDIKMVWIVSSTAFVSNSKWLANSMKSVHVNPKTVYIIENISFLNCLRKR